MTPADFPAGLALPRKLAALLRAADAFSREHNPQHAHCRQVTRLALCILRELRAQHSFSADEVFCLALAAQLHDVGYAVAFKGHHKHSRDLILRLTLPIPAGLRQVAAMVARYHRKGVPTNRQRRFIALDGKEREQVRRLAAILRIADGLDRTHQACVRGVQIKCRHGIHTFMLQVAGDCAIELRTVRQKKIDLFEKVYGKTVWEVIPGAEVGHAGKD